MDANVRWKEGLSFTGSADSGFEVPLGADPKVGGRNDGFRPMELMALSLAGCTAMDVISIMTKKRQEVAAFEVKVRTERATEHPKVFTEAVIEYVFAGRGIQEDAVRRSIELSAQVYCPAQAMLGRIVPIHIDYLIFEGESPESGKMVVRGRWEPEE